MKFALPGRTPLDIRLGLTNAADVAHPLRWGILGITVVVVVLIVTSLRRPG